MSTSLLGAITFIVVFAGIIFVHELGHFLAARSLKIEVEEFAFGFPPRLLRLWRGKGSLQIGKEKVTIPINFKFPFDPKASLNKTVHAQVSKKINMFILRSISLDEGVDKKDSSTSAETVELASSTSSTDVKNKKPSSTQDGSPIELNGSLSDVRLGTEFTLNWIPLGGYNKIRGEDDPTAPGGMASAKPWKRILVLLAGATMNLLTAVLVYSVFFSQIGIPDSHTVIIASITYPSPAETAGLQVGDTVLSAAGIHVTGYSSLTDVIHSNFDKAIPLGVLRSGKLVEVTITPLKYPSDQGPMGVTIGQPLLPATSWFATLPISFSATWMDINNLLALPGQIIAGTISPEAAQIGGPRSVWNLFQQAVSRDVSSRQLPTSGAQTAVPTNYTLLIIISLTVTVAVANLLPIPALDGGRIFMTLIEMVIRRNIPAKFQMAINGIGFIIMVTLLGIFYIKDLINPISFTLP